MRITRNGKQVSPRPFARGGKIDQAYRPLGLFLGQGSDQAMHAGVRGAGVLSGVDGLWCKVPAVPAGRDPELAQLTLAMKGPAGPVHLFTSGRLRPQPSSR